MIQESVDIHAIKPINTIALIGLGFVGLPLALHFIEKGFSVIGIDIDQKKVDQLKKGVSYISGITNADLLEAQETKRFSVSTDYNNIKSVNTIIICVPTPITPYNTPDLRYLQDVGTALSGHIKKGQLIILESSTYPGTTKEILQSILEKSGLKAGEDFFLAYSPERIDPGNKNYDLQDIPKIISGLTLNCLNEITSIYSQVFKKIIPVSSLEVAELTKLLENSYRFINISFINEMAILCDEINIDIWEVIEAASTKPYGFQPFYPGPGIGGHCIPIDPLYLAWKVEQFGLKSSYIQLADQINKIMPQYIFEQLIKHFVDGSKQKILVCGLCYKKDIADIRQSPPLEIFKLLIDKGYQVNYYDPFIPEVSIDGNAFKSIDLTNEEIATFDYVLILTDHTKIPIQRLLNHAKIIYDTRNLTNGLSGNAKVLKLGGGEL
jgi:UDP-N-acetyl-D-glucosamine dehydrogenase